MSPCVTEKIVLIGAGSAMFTQGVVSDLIRSGMEVELALVDIDPVALETAYRLSARMIAARRAPISLMATIERKEVLPGATVVITTIGVGGRRAWEQDVFIPRKYGLYYAVGDTTGPGGTSRALRMIPPMVAVARDVLDLAPDALFFNYANPMAPICRAVRTATGANVIGLCIGTFDTWHYLARAIDETPEALSFSAGGINHLTWFYNICANGQDVMSKLRGIAAQRLEALAETVRTGQIPHCGSPFDSSMDFPFSWQCLLWFNAYPAPQDRHVTEFFSQFFRAGEYYGKTLGVDEFSFEGTIAAGDSIYAEMRRDALSPDPLTEAYFEKLGGEHEQVIEIIHSVRGNQHKRFFANLPNTGQVPNLPLGAVLETPVIVDSNGVHPIMQASLPTAAAGVLATRFAWVDVVVEAALERSRTKLIDALILDGGVKSSDIAAALADDLLETHRAYLPDFNG
jgi:alpha-galactosidase